MGIWNFINDQRILIKDKKENSQNNVESLCLTFTINCLVDIMDEIANLLDPLQINASIVNESKGRPETIGQILKQAKIIIMATPLYNKGYEERKQKAKELIAAGGCYALQYWSHTDALRLCPQEHSKLESHLEAPIYISEWIDTAKKAIQLIQDGIDLIHPNITKNITVNESKESVGSEDGGLTFNVMVRHTGAQRDGNGNIIFPEHELKSWFEHLQHLKSYTEHDKL